MNTQIQSPATSPPKASAKMSEAAERVFDTVELCKLILLEVDERTLLLSQRVSKTFRNTIQGSIKLQQ